MSCNHHHHQQQQQQQPQHHQPSIAGSVSTSRAPLSTAGYSIQESRRRMLETIDRRRSEMLSHTAAAAMTRGPQIGSVGSAAAPTGLMQMPRLQSASATATPVAAAAAASSTLQQSATAATAVARHRYGGFVNSFPTPNGGAFTHMKFPPGRGSLLQHQHQHQNQHHLGSLAAVPGGAMRAMASAGAVSRPAGVVQAPADSTAPAVGAGRRDRTRVRQQQHQQPQQQKAAPSNSVPNHTTQMPPALPEVTLQPHPFFALVAEVMRPTSLLPLRLGHRMQAAELSFTLSKEQAETVALGRQRNPATQRTEYGIQVQLRCCQIGTGAQPDCFPPGVSLAVNKNQVASLPPPLPSNKPNADPIRPGRPVNISGHCRISHAVLNRLTLTWLHDPGVLGYCVSVALVRSVSVGQLTQLLLANEPIAAAETRARVVELLGGGSGTGNSGDELRLTDLTASLRCPLSRSRIGVPARGVSCSHLQCFDAPAYLAMNERRPAWRCPCCDRCLPPAELRVDAFFRQVLDSEAAAAPVDTVRFLPDGAWLPATADRSQQQQQQQNQQPADGLVVDLTDDAPVLKPQPPPPPLPAPAPPAAAASAAIKRPAASVVEQQDGDIVVITLDSSDDEEDATVRAAAAPVPAKRHRPEENPDGNPASPKIAGNPSANPASLKIAGDPSGNLPSGGNHSSGLAASGFSGGPIPLPPAFLQDQQRLSALLSGVGQLRHPPQGCSNAHSSPSGH